MKLIKLEEKNNTEKIIAISLVLVLIILASISVIILRQMPTLTNKNEGIKINNLNPKFEQSVEAPQTGEAIWQLDMLMYDSTVDEGRKQIFEDTWHATTNDKRIITIQIDYRNLNVVRAYAPGELKITVDNLGKLYPTNSAGDKYKEVSSISADTAASKDKKFEWSYTYSSSTNKYTFTNNKAIEANSNFEGTIQLVYEFEAIDLLNDSEVILNASLTDPSLTETVNSANTLKFTFTSTERTATMSKYAYKISSYDGLGENAQDYVWAEMKTSVSFNLYSGVRSRVYDGYYIETVPKGCILLDSYMQKQSPIEEGGNTYKLSSVSRYYIGYPKDQYTGQTLKAKTQYYGKIAESYYYNGDKAKEEKLLAEKEINVKMEDFEVKWDKGHYIYKYTSNQKLSYSKIINPNYGEDISYTLSFISRHYDHDLKIQFGDDLLYITDANGDYRKLKDNEYYFKSATIPAFRNGNEIAIEKDKYNMKLFVRYSGTTDYVQYGEDFKNSTSSKTITFTENNVVGWYVEIYDTKETIDAEYRDFYTTVHVQTSEDLIQTGIIRNFNMLRVLKKDTEGNEVLDNIIKLENYSNIAQSLNIDKEDIERFGTYANRTEASSTYDMDTVDMDTYFLYNFSESQDNEYFYRDLVIYSRYGSHGTGTNKFNGYRMYFIAPEGVEINTTKEEIIDTLIGYSSTYTEFVKQDGTKFKNLAEYNDFIKEHTTVNINKNYKNTGRLWVEMIVDYHESPLNIYNVSNSTYMDIFHIPVKIPYESYFTHGRSYTFNSYITLLNDTEKDYVAYYKYTDTNDVDNDGIVTDYYTNSESITTTILPAVSSYQEVNKSVWTENTENQWVSDIATVRQGGEYKYKLRVRTGINNIKNLIIYDNLEEEGGWKGTFQGLDLSFTNGQGYTPKVYYSTLRNAGTLEDNRDAWLEYNEGVDKTQVKSLAFDYQDQIVHSGSITFVIIKMKAPDNVENTELSANRCRTSWTAVTNENHVIENVTGIESNITLLGKPDSKDKITVYKNWEDNDNALGLRPESVGVTLLQNGNVYQSATLNNGTGWKYEFTVPMADQTGKMYEYTVREENVDLYTTSVENTSDEVNQRYVRSFTITNTIKEDEIYVDIVGEKTWQDENDKRNVRPETVTVNLLRDGEKIKSKTIGEADNWSYEFLREPVWKNRTEKYTYSVTEESVPAYYTSNVTETFGNGLKIKFSSECKTENVKYDYVEIYYKQNGKTYKAGKLGGTNFGNVEITIPARDFYLYWKTDNTNDGYYGFKIDSIKLITIKESGTTNTATLPSGTPEEVTGSNYPESLHGNYGNNVTKLWHYSSGSGAGGEASDFFKIFNITNTFTMPESTISDSITKEGTAKIARIDEPISYKINYTAQVTNYEGNAKVTITDTLPYAIDETKTDMESGLSGGVYDKSTNTITWIENKNNIATLAEPYTISVEKNITVVFKDIDTTKELITNTVKGKIDLLSTEKTKETEPVTYNTATEYTVDVTAIKEWNHGESIYAKPEKVVLQVENVNEPGVVVQSYEVGADENWSHVFRDLPKYDSNRNEIEYTITEKPADELKYYEAVAEKTSEGIKLVNTYIGPIISATKTCMTEHNGDYAQIGEQVTYTITVKNEGRVEKDVVVKDTIPEGTMFEKGTIKVNDQLEEYTEEDLVTNGITVNVPAEGETTVSFSVIVTDEVTDHITNVATINKYPENPEQPEEKTNEITTPVVMKETRVVVHHYFYDSETQQETNVKLASADVIEGLVRDAYTTKPSEKVSKNYVCIDMQPEKYEGTMTEEEIHVNYYYTLTTPKISNKIEKSVVNREKMTKEDEVVAYNIKYDVTVVDYIGDVTVKIIDKLPASIDLSKSNINSGKYNKYDKTITWTETIKGIDTYTNGPYKQSIGKSIKVVYTDQNAAKDLENEVTGETIVYYPKEHPNNSGKEQKNETSTDKSIVKQDYRVNVKVEKEWNDNNNEKGHRPESVIITIKEKAGKEEIKLELNEENNWKGEALDLPKYDETGRKLEYVVTEGEVNQGDLDYYGDKQIVKSETQTEKVTDYTYKVINTYVELDGDVIVKHVAKDTGEELAPSEKYTGRIGSKYETKEKEFDKYQFSYTDPENRLVTIEEGENIITYYYERIPSGEVVVKYLDEETGEEIPIIEEDEDGTINERKSGYEIKGYVGDPYYTSEEKFEYYDLVSEPTNASGELTKEESTVVYHYKKKNFNLSIEKELMSVLLNGEERNISDKKISKIDIDKKSIDEAVLDVKYIIRVTNTGEIAGTAKVSEIIPKGYKLLSSNVEWTENNEQNLETTVNVNVGETKELEVTLRWLNSNDNFGSFENTATIVETTNVPNFEDTIKEDNTSTATIITEIKTGFADMPILQIILAVVGISLVTSMSGILIIKFNKKEM